MRFVAIILTCFGMIAGTAGCAVTVRRPAHRVYVEAPPPRRVVVVRPARTHVHVHGHGHVRRHHSPH